MSTATLSTAVSRRPVAMFLRHLGEMTLSMLVGMFGFGLVLGVVAGIAGSSLESLRVSQPELFMLGMGSAMSATMIAWMRHRGLTWHAGREMTAAMFRFGRRRSAYSRLRRQRGRGGVRRKGSTTATAPHPLGEPEAATRSPPRSPHAARGLEVVEALDSVRVPEIRLAWGRSR